MKKLTPLLLEEVAGNGGFTHIVRFTASDLTTTAAATAQVILLPTVPAGFIINKAIVRLVTPFEDLSDAAYNTTTFSFGDAGSATRYVSAVQVNRNGTEITVPAFDNTAYELTAAAALQVTFNSQTGKSLVDIDKGELHLLLQIIDTRSLSEQFGSRPIVKA